MKRPTCLPTVLVVALLGCSAPAAAAPPTIEAIIKAEGQFTFTDGSSVFQLKKGGAFSLDPVGVSGRTIRGVWRTRDHRRFSIVGKWSWVNGLSRDNDYRRMWLQLAYRPGLPKPPKLSRRTGKLRSVYFTVEELVAVTKATYDKRQSGR